jgi:hypothetical protein
MVSHEGVGWTLYHRTLRHVPEDITLRNRVGAWPGRTKGSNQKD